MQYNRLLEGIIDIYSNPGRYLLVRQTDHNSPQRTKLRGEYVTIKRSKNRIEFLFLQGRCNTIHPLTNHIVTLPTTTDAVEHCRYLSSRIERFRSYLFTSYRIESVMFVDHTVAGNNTLADVVIQKFQAGDLLSEASQVDRKDLLRAVDLLEQTLIEFNISFRELTPDNIIIGLDGRLYPLRYDTLQFSRTAESRECEELRVWINDNIEINEHQMEVTYNKRTPMKPYPKRSSSLYTGHISVGDYHEDRVAVEESTGWGFVDGLNRIVIEPNYLYVDSFREGRSVVERDSGWGIIDLWGDEVVPTIYESIGYNANSGVIVARKDRLWGYFNYRGEQLTPFKFDHPNEDISREELAELIGSSKVEVEG